MNDLISVIIITYNMADLLRNAICSLKEQTNQNFEIIVVDNHSIDHTEDVINSFSELDIKYIKVHNEGVLSVSRNEGTKLAKGNWMAYLDADDYWMPDKIQQLYNVIEQIPDDYVAISHDFVLNDVRSGKKVTHKCEFDTENLQKELIMGENRIALSGTAVRKDSLLIVNGFSEDVRLKTVEDYDLWIRLSGIGKFFFLHKPLAMINLHDGNYSKKADIQMAALDYLKHNYLDGELSVLFTYDEKQQAYNYSDTMRARILQKNGFFDEAADVCKDLFRRRVITIKLLIIYLFTLIRIAK